MSTSPLATVLARQSKKRGFSMKGKPGAQSAAPKQPKASTGPGALMQAVTKSMKGIH